MLSVDEATNIWARQLFIIETLQPSEITSVEFANIVMVQGKQFADCKVHLTDYAIWRLNREGNWFPQTSPQDYLYQYVDYDLAQADIVKIQHMNDVGDKSDLDERFNLDLRINNGL